MHDKRSGMTHKLWLLRSKIDSVQVLHKCFLVIHEFRVQDGRRGLGVHSAPSSFKTRMTAEGARHVLSRMMPAQFTSQAGLSWSLLHNAVQAFSPGPKDRDAFQNLSLKIHRDRPPLSDSRGHESRNATKTRLRARNQTTLYLGLFALRQPPELQTTNPKRPALKASGSRVLKI